MLLDESFGGGARCKNEVSHKIRFKLNNLDDDMSLTETTIHMSN